MSYLDFDLEIGLGSDGKYPVTVHSPAGDAQVRVRFPFNEQTLRERLKDLQIALLQSGDVRRKVLSHEQQLVQDFGQKLFESIISGEARTRYDACRQMLSQQTGSAGVRLRLSIQAPELAGLPWEFLYDPRQGEYICLSRATPLVRYLPLSQPAQPLTVTPPLRILCMIASPSDQEQLDITREKQRIKSALDTLESQGLVQLHWLSGQTWSDLQQAMWRGPWHIFHFIGHGGFDPTLQEGVLALTNEYGKTNLMSATQLARLLADHQHLRLALLNACEGARSGEKDIFSSTAATLARGGIPAVLAMQYEISDRAAIQLTRTFYSALANGLPVDEAVAEVRKAISVDAPKTLEWGTPVLYLRSHDGMLFNVTGQPKAGAPAAATPAPAGPGPTVRGEKTKEDWLEEGNAHARAGRHQEALAAYDAALRLDPNFARAYFGKGDTLRLLNRYDEALAALNRAIELDPRTAAAYRRKAYVLNQRQRYEEALTTLNSAIQLEPNYASAYVAKGDALKELKRYTEALTSYDQAIRLDARLADAHIGTGDVQRELAHYTEALAAYDQALKLDPKNTRATYGKRLAQERLAGPPPATAYAPGAAPQPGAQYQPGQPGTAYAPGSAQQSPLVPPPPPYTPPSAYGGQAFQAAPPFAPSTVGAPGFPGGAAVQRGPKRNLYLIIGGIAAGVLLICSITGYFLLTAYNAPSGVASAFYTDLQHQNFAGAYQYLDSSLKTALSEPTFINELTCTDTTAGVVSSFSTSVSSNNFNQAMVQVSVTRTKISSYVDTLSLTNEPGGWLITQSQNTFVKACQTQ